eukprot:TRINITY_DN20288_c0_g1_i1.p1 TRINITY_DN20288_c0_g1~~TRINITY_DN20288_c0_g1_i1.p1  ORF type:complete len:817 (+),score=282.33 TRINITY_DN20288_c0_g1_i1:63-2453(+)
MPFGERVAARTRHSWQSLLESSSDAAHVVRYEAGKILNVLLGEGVLEPTVGHQLDSLTDLFSVVLFDTAGRFAGAASAAVGTFPGFLAFLERSHNTKPSPLLREAENRVATLLYLSAGAVDLCTATSHVAAFAPFLMHSAYVQLRTMEVAGPRTFGCPPRVLPDQRRLQPHDQFVWLMTAVLPLIPASCFQRLLQHHPDDAEFQVLYLIEVLELSLYNLDRMLEQEFAAPLRIKRPSAAAAAAEPKVLPQKMLSFLPRDAAELHPSPGDWYAVPGDKDPAAPPWTFQWERNEEHSRALRQRLEIIAAAGPIPAALAAVHREEPVFARVTLLRIEVVCRTTSWVLVSAFAYLHSQCGGAPPPETSALVSLSHAAAAELESCIVDTVGSASRLTGQQREEALLLLLRGALCVVASEKVFEAFHPQGALRHAPPRGTAEDDAVRAARAAVAPCLVPLLLLLQTSSLAGRSSVFSAMTQSERVPALELCTTRFLHDLYLLHLEFTHVCAKEYRQRAAAVAVPAQNAFRGLHAGLAELMPVPEWREAMDTPVSGGVPLLQYWAKSVEVAKCFAALPDDPTATRQTGQAARDRALTVSKSAWALVHYFFQRSRPSAPTAPPALAATALSRGPGGRCWDDYDEYFSQMDGAPSASSIRDLELDFPLTPPSEATVSYRLSRLLSSHLRGLCDVIPYFRVLYLACRRCDLLSQCGYYCASLSDLIERSRHNHGVAVPFLLAALRCYEDEGAVEEAVATAQRLTRILRVLQDLPCSSLLHVHSQQLVAEHCAMQAADDARAQFRRQ